jgi:hypothetical protein
MLGHVFGDFILNIENILKLAVVALRPEVIPVGHVDELGRHAKPVPGFADASFEDGVYL